MDEPQLGLGLRGAVEEGDVRPFPVAAVFLNAIAHLLGDGLDLAEVRARDPAGELAQTLVHQNGNHADLDALIEIFAAAGKTQPQTVIQVDMSHSGKPPSFALSGHLLFECIKKRPEPEGGMDAHLQRLRSGGNRPGEPLISPTISLNGRALMAERRISAFFDTYDEAARAVERLEAARLPNFEISLVSNNFDDAHTHHATRSFDAEGTSHEFAGATAAAGSVAGAGAGLLAGLGTVAVPGFGPVIAAGWLVSTLVGAGAGAAVGGLAGALADAGLSDEEAQHYAEGVRRGGALVTVKVDEAQMDRVVRILDDEGEIEPSEEARAADESPAPPIGAAASTTTGLMTDLMPIPVDDEDDHTLHVEVQDERLRRSTGTRSE